MRVLMLHGYAQSGDFFRQKCSGLVRRILQTYQNAEFCWPDGPVDLHGQDSSGSRSNSHNFQAHVGTELRAWFHLRDKTNPPAGLTESLDAIASVLRRHGPFDGIIAFSQRTLLAATVASLLQGESRKDAYQEAVDSSRHVLQFPQAFSTLDHPLLKFGVLYATRIGHDPYYDWLYENPKIETPFCLVIGQWDPMVEKEETCAASRKLCGGGKPRMLEHDGSHFVPNDVKSTTQVVDFITHAVPSHSRSLDMAGAERDPQGQAVDANALRERLQSLVSASRYDFVPPLSC